MRGLLLKDWYYMKNYCKVFWGIIVVFIIAACFTEGKQFFLYYPCILSGMISMTLIAYEEKEGWNVYAGTLPISRTQIVSSKYMVSLIFSGFVVAAMLLVQLATMLYRQAFDGFGMINLATSLIPLSLLPTAILLPFIYKFGAEKGRMVYYVVVGLFCGLFIVLGNMGIFETSLASIKYSNVVLCSIAIVVFGISWLLSIGFYQEKEI